MTGRIDEPYALKVRRKSTLSEKKWAVLRASDGGSVGGRPVRGHWWRHLAGIMGTIIGSAMSRSGNHLQLVAN